MAYLIKKFTGKKLLLLGTNPGTCDMVNYARNQGAYVIVTDNQPTEKSAGKQISDEAWLVSTADVDTLEKLAIKHQVNGIFAGVSEFNLERALTLCERLGLPFYCNRKQWETCSNKQSFKQLCLANDVPVAREFKIDSNYKSEDLRQVRYPVIVKPVDKSAGTGIRICRDQNELLNAYTTAVSMSKTSEAIAEEFIDGEEINAGYTIKGGELSLSYVLDRYLDPEPGETMPLPQATILPSKYTDQYLEGLNARVIKMFQSMGLNNGFIFVQCIVNKDGIYIFETNYRFDAGLWYRVIGRLNGISYMEMMVNHALTGKMEGYDLSLDNSKFNKHSCLFPLLSKEGEVGKIIGLEEIRNKKNLISVDQSYTTGDYIEKSGTLRQTIFKFVFIENTIQELKNSIKEIQNTVKVLDDKGENMLLPPFDTDRI